VRAEYESSGRLATYYMPGTLHQHVIRPAFFTGSVGGVTLAQFVTNVLAGELAQVGP
jgi:hypothetical protein